MHRLHGTMESDEVTKMITMVRSRLALPGYHPDLWNEEHRLDYYAMKRLSYFSTVDIANREECNTAYYSCTLILLFIFCHLFVVPCFYSFFFFESAHLTL